jgi:hypothetical protein
MAISLVHKIIIALIAAVVFFLISAPFTYNITNKIIKTKDSKGCPSMQGIIIHSVVFFIIISYFFLFPWARINLRIFI